MGTKKERKSVDFVAGNIVGESKKWPLTAPCTCGDTMDLISIEEAYSCRRKACEFHLEGE